MQTAVYVIFTAMLRKSGTSNSVSSSPTSSSSSESACTQHFFEAERLGCCAGFPDINLPFPECLTGCSAITISKKEHTGAWQLLAVRELGSV